MPLDRCPWDQLPDTVHQTVARHVGGTYSAADTVGGGNSAVAVVLTTATGSVFVKGIRADDGQADELALEHRVNSYLPDLCPRVLWQTETAGWVLLAFDAVTGEHADYAPGSADLEAVITTLTALSGTPAPPVALLNAWDRWGYYCADDDKPLFDGDSLLHTDLAATNILMNDGRAHVVDWSWAARGPAWIDPALWGIRLISDGGHTPAEATRRAREVPAFHMANPRAVAALSRAEADRWAALDAEGTPGIEGVTRGARQWADHWAR
ncbi:aminoglycoside phosphotransferase [Streptomyces sp. NBC_01433]|uniref:aminoglycoside phosphotransferase n=1 Tax=Streptomyces sp. NBC_01433 TaxID=2903864 RepID=UPI00224DB740|nr:aminoglycoside phosphotransferase [Streptomyces sp. NBC_01433]MCX4679144.1 aminoglycoside phosphotransferase [Streptomyces sp. NBC_01433]